VFSNLVSNSIKHHIGDAYISISIDATRVNGLSYCRAAVEDNGPVIPDNFKDKVFNRLLRGTTKANGMGLGLYLVKSLVESYLDRYGWRTGCPETTRRAADSSCYCLW